VDKSEDTLGRLKKSSVNEDGIIELKCSWNGLDISIVLIVGSTKQTSKTC